MSKITLDPGLKVKLNGLNEPMEVCDEAGAIVGRFLPESTYRQYFCAWLKSQISGEEIARLRQQTGGKSLAETWREVAAEHGGAELANADLELLEEMLAGEHAEELARKLDWKRLLKAYPPSQEWFDRDEPRPF